VASGTVEQIHLYLQKWRWYERNELPWNRLAIHREMARRRAFVRGLAALFAHLHARNIYHNDLKDFNILVAPKIAGGESFYLLDLEGVRRFGQLSQRRRVKNLVQLNRTLGKLVTGAEAMRFLKCYLETQSERPIQCKTWARSIVRQSRKVDRQKLVVPRINA
jgi:tRNA A-37 threonylcarbamoyl transferase component Bud32